MSFAECLNDAVDEGSADADRARRAQAMWEEIRDRYIRQGYDQNMAEAAAAEDVKAAFRKEFGDARHEFLGLAAAMRKAELEIGEADLDALATIGTDKVEHMDHTRNKGLTYVGQVNALRRHFHGRLSELVTKHHRDILGNAKDKAGLLNIARELHGKSTGDTAAHAFAKGVREAMSEARRMFNEAGGTIGDLEDWGLPHSHNAMAITKAGFERWFDDTHRALDWSRIVDPLTGRPMAKEGAQPPLEAQRSFLRYVYDNIAFGKDTPNSMREVTFGRQQGKNLLKQHGERRVLHFKDPDGWIEYNRQYGTGDVFGSIISHMHRMSEDIIAMREFGKSPELMFNYRRALAAARVREAGREDLIDKVNGNFEHAKRMFRLQRGGLRPENLRQAQVARFFSTTRHLLSAAMLDRAIIASISDTNSMRMAAKSIGLNPNNVLARHMDLLTNGATRAQLGRAGWIADTLADPGLILSRWQNEYPSAEIAERLSSGVMRAQGLAHWTDQARIAFQAEMAGYMADFAGRNLDEVDEPLRSLLRDKGITDDDWKAFTRPEHLFSPQEGITFASPMWWRAHTDLPDEIADDIFLKIQSVIEEQTEFAVPTQNLWARSWVDGYAPPGTIMHEIAKSGLMIKSFAMTFTTNQVSRTMAKKGVGQRAGYAFDLIAGATVMGAVALQLGEMFYGRDPRPMANADFWAASLLKGGGFGVMGDLIAAGQTSWGGGFSSYIAGPGVQFVGEAWNLSVGNAVDVMTGGETHFGRDLVRFVDRYSPGTDIPVVGLALDRLLWDSLHSLLDPESEKAMRRAATVRENRYGNDTWWTPGSLTPERGPDMAAALQ